MVKTVNSPFACWFPIIFFFKLYCSYSFPCDFPNNFQLFICHINLFSCLAAQTVVCITCYFVDFFKISLVAYILSLSLLNKSVGQFLNSVVANHCDSTFSIPPTLHLLLLIPPLSHTLPTLHSFCHIKYVVSHCRYTCLSYTLHFWLPCLFFLFFGLFLSICRSLCPLVIA